METKAENLSFERSLENLEKLVAQIEQGEVSLEESIQKYAEGIALVKRCRAILDTAEKKIQLLQKGERGAAKVAGELPDSEPTDSRE